MKKQLLLSLGILFSVISIFGQSGENDLTKLPMVMPSQPEAAELGRYGDIPVSKYTGIPNISIPLYSIQSEDIEIPISLSYHAGGIRVSQEATWVGLGWSLNGVTGVVTRTIKGRKDEKWGYFQNNNKMFDVYDNGFLGSYGTGVSTYFVPGFSGHFQEGIPVAASGMFFHPSNMKINGIVPNNNLTSRLIRAQNIDWEPDLFTFSFLGYSGSFVIDQDGNIHLIDKSTNFSIHKLSGYEMGYEIIAPNGTKAEFTERVIHYTIGNPESQKIDWFISKVTSSNGNQIIFNYSRPQAGAIYTSGYNETFDLYSPTFKYNKSRTNSYYSPAYLDRVTFTNGYIEFEKSNREDYGYNGKAKKLDKISIFNTNDEKIKEFQFLNDYFISPIGSGTGTTKGFIDISFGSSATEETKSTLTKRLKLTSVIELVNGVSKDYTFEYNNTILPQKTSFSTDFLGYYNGKSNNSFISDYTGGVKLSVNDIPAINNIVHNQFVRHLKFDFPNVNPADRSPNLNATKACVLEKIIYPTKGTTTFEYGLNEYIADEPDYIEKEESVVFSNIGNPSNPTENESVTFTVPSNALYNKGAIIRINAYNSNGDFGPFDKISVTGNNTFNLNELDGYPFNSVNNYIEYINVVPNQVITMTIHKQSGFSGVIQASILYYTAEIGQNKKSEGLRIEKIINDGKKENLEIKKYVYNDENQKTYGINKIPSRFYNNIYFRDISDNIITNFKHTRFYGLATTSLSYNQNNKVGYSKVMEIKGETMDKGYIEYNYINKYGSRFGASQMDRPVWLPIHSFQFDGKLDSEKYFSGNYKLVRDVKYNYEMLNMILVKAFYRGYVQNGGTIQDTFNIRFYGGLHYYPILTKREALVKKTDRVYDINGENPLTTIIDYSYNTNTHLQLTKTETTTSNNETIVSKTYYPQDKNQLSGLSTEASIAIDSLIAQHQIAIPIQTETTKNGLLTSKIRLNYKDFGVNTLGTNNTILPKSVQALKELNGLETRIIYHKYDSKGNVLEVSKANGVHICYVWGYNQTSPVAKIENINYEDLPQTELEALQNLDYTTATEAVVLQKLENLRAALPNAMVTTMTYKPLIGINTVTDPKGDIQYFTYDTFNRLQYVKDKDGNILKRNDYHYKNQ